MVGVSAQAAEIKVLSGNGARAAVSELAARFERSSGHKVTIQFAVNPETKKKIEGGEAFDVAILNPPVLDDLIRQGRIVRVSSAAREPRVAREMLKFFTSPSAATVLSATGIEPFVE